MIAIVDYGPLYAATDTDDDYYSRCLEVLERRDLDLIVSALDLGTVRQ